MNGVIGYVYMLKNDSFESNLFKIGFTKTSPSERAAQIFKGATGVPEPFSVVFACKVIDYKKAEKLIHNSLKAYRVSRRREFFRIPLSIGKDVILEVCDKINIEHGVSIDNPVNIPDIIDESELQDTKSYHWVNVDDICLQSMFFSTLTNDQERRISIVHKILGSVYSESLSTWMDDFRKDGFPEREIKVWEGIAKAYLKVDSRFSLSNNSAREAYNLLLMRSGSKKSDVIEKYKPEFFSPSQVSEILDCYELKPMPIVVERIRCMSNNTTFKLPND
ncbi:GIY-YIG nuclease family protein [Serratia rubidaea]|uniref:GIY-YIG nuclease family protein n=1 Tax=Serratia rubidaea TaxID=61652 RepID=UPI002430B5C6|nr:GIY-YIG nuclease family protein [Serratia rubidaea]MCR1000946.1 GIY-YIG nuclease family protein [Serratia rubidaea]